MRKGDNEGDRIGEETGRGDRKRTAEGEIARKDDERMGKVRDRE